MLTDIEPESLNSIPESTNGSGVRQPRLDANVMLARIEKVEKKRDKRIEKNRKTSTDPEMDRTTESFFSKPAECLAECDLSSETSTGYGAKILDKMLNLQNKMMKAVKLEEEEEPMIFFDKNNASLREKFENQSLPEENADLNDGQPAGDEEITPATGGVDSKAVWREVFDWAKHIIIAVVIGLLLVTFVVQRNEVIGSSMEPNLYEGDQLLVQKISRLFDKGIQYGDIITINAEGLTGHSGDKNIIKRVIGLPGDKIEIKNDHVYRNGALLDEPYIDDSVITFERDAAYSNVTLGKKEIYVLGDNRVVSLDSRAFGPIERSRVIGEVLIRFYPLDSFGKP